MDVDPPEFELNWALTVVLVLRVNEQTPVPEHALPLQPINVLPAAGVAVNVTIEPGDNDSVQMLPQFNEPPARVTVPTPLPTLATESNPTGVGVKFAMTLL